VVQEWNSKPKGEVPNNRLEARDEAFVGDANTLSSELQLVGGVRAQRDRVDSRQRFSERLQAVCGQCERAAGESVQAARSMVKIDLWAMRMCPTRQGFGAL
jgi:hypothetical protein